MGRRAFPWYWEGRRAWFVWHKGERVNLGADEAEAFALWHRLEAGVEERPTGPAVGEIIDAYLADAEPRLKASTQLSKRKVLDRLKDDMGEKPATQLSAGAALAFLNKQAWGQSL